VRKQKSENNMPNIESTNFSMFSSDIMFGGRSGTVKKVNKSILKNKDALSTKSVTTLKSQRTYGPQNSVPRQNSIYSRNTAKHKLERPLMTVESSDLKKRDNSKMNIRTQNNDRKRMFLTHSRKKTMEGIINFPKASLVSSYDKFCI